MKDMPDKLYYSISEVASFAEVKAHVLRYWESEFPTLKPKKNRAGNRSYRKRDVDEVRAIKTLLYDEGYKIDGARRILRDRSGSVVVERLQGQGCDEDVVLRAPRLELADSFHEIAGPSITRLARADHVAQGTEPELFALTIAGAVLADGDADGDGSVDGDDLEVWISQYGQTGAPLLAPATGAWA